MSASWDMLFKSHRLCLGAGQRWAHEGLFQSYGGACMGSGTQRSRLQRTRVVRRMMLFAFQQSLLLPTATTLDPSPRKGCYRDIFISDQPFWLLNLKDSSCQYCCQGE